MPPIESNESSSPIVTRSVAAGLQGIFCDNYEFPGWQKSLLTLLGGLPQKAASFAISHFEALNGLDPDVLMDFSLDALIHQRLNDYLHLDGHFPSISIGAALGGATAYLSLALGGPFLPEAFVTTLKGGAKTGDVKEYLNRSLRMAMRIADENPGLMTIQHYDPIHDGWMTRFVNHLRFKLLELPPAYEDFIRKRLTPGGSLVYLQGGASWLRYRLGPRSVFQVGGWGGISAKEFLENSDRIQRYARKAGITFTDWRLPDYPLEQGPESEWGSEPGLEETLQAFCERYGFRFVPIRLPHPNDFSRLAFAAAHLLLKKEGRPPAGVLVEMFSQFDATAAMQAGLLPLWLVYNTQDSLQFLKDMRPHFPADRPVFFSPLATFSYTPDMAPWADWENALKESQWINIGTRPSHYPADARTLVRWAEPLRKWVLLNLHPIKSSLEAKELESLASEIGSKTL
jgi:hypothetical protein